MVDHVYAATVRWSLQGDFAANDYKRLHQWEFDGGITVPGSASPLVVPPPRGTLEAVDPEEALVAAVSSCHMLFFLDYCRRAGLVVTAYEDKADGILEKIEGRRMAMTKITLRPAITLAAAPEDEALLTTLHEKAHNACFIANSLKTEVVVEQAPVAIANAA